MNRQFLKIIRSARSQEMRGSADRVFMDMIRRCNKSLEDYEAKLHLVEKFMSVKKVHEIDLLLENYEEQDEKN